MAYADRRNTMTKEALRAMSKWANKPQTEKQAKVPDQHRQLWQTLNDFVMARSGQIVSPMFVFPIRLEVAPDSELPARLRTLGYDLIYREQDTRIGAPMHGRRWGRLSDLNKAYSFRQVDVFELRLPK
jgi:hypothetical protein